MELSVNKKVWQYIIIVLSLMIIIISFLFYIKPIFIAAVLGILVTIFIDQSIEMFKKFTNDWTPSKRRLVAVVCVLGIILFGSIFMVSAAISVKNNFEDLLEIYDNFNNQYNEMAEELTEELMDIANESTGMVNNTSNITNVSGNQTRNNSTPPPNISVNFLRNARTDIIKATLTSSSGLMTSTKEILSLITSTVFASALIIPLTALYYFKEKGKITQKIVSLAPDKYKNIFEKTIQDIINDIGAYTIVKVFEAIIISFLYCASFYVIGLPHWLTFGLLMGIFNIVSYVGFVLPTVPVIVYAYSVGTEIMYAVVGAIIVIQLFDFFFILPNMIMKTIKVSPLTAVLLTLVGLKLFGFFGLVFALPIYIFCKIFLIACYKLLVVMYPDPNDWQEATDD
ncbi:MAG: AI-2E family transporter [Methanimicrococcus sp.]|nr:AI-2E family transporter [Methanimicrococcus sp.]